MKLPEAMIEKAAKALFDRLEGSRPLDSNSELRRNTSRDIARVALEAALAECHESVVEEACETCGDCYARAPIPWIGKRVALVPIDD